MARRVVAPASGRLRALRIRTRRASPRPPPGCQPEINPSQHAGRYVVLAATPGATANHRGCRRTSQHPARRVVPGAAAGACVSRGVTARGGHDQRLVDLRARRRFATGRRSSTATAVGRGQSGIQGLEIRETHLGIGLGILLATISGLLEFNTLSQFTPVVVVFSLGQLLESMWLTPNLVGDRIGLHPVTVIFSLLAGGQLFGFTGVLLALPASAAIAVALRHLRRQYFDGNLYQ